MKKLFCIFVKLVLVLALILPMIGDNVASAEQYEIAVVAKNAESQWGLRQELGVRDYARASGNIAYQRGPSRVDAAAQLQILEDLIAQRVDAICVVPVDIDSVQPALQRAMDAGIVVIVNEGTTVDVKDYSIDAFDQEMFGHFMMESLAKQMGETGFYTTMVGSLSNGSHNLWADAAIAWQKEKYPNMQLLESDSRVESSDLTEISYSKAKELIMKYPDLKGILGTSSADLPGIAQAVEELGLSGSFAIAGLGTPLKSSQFLASGSLIEFCMWDPAGAGWAMCALAEKMLSGVPIEAGLDLGLEGYHSIQPSAGNPKNFEGQGMVTVNKETVGNYDF